MSEQDRELLLKRLPSMSDQQLRTITKQLISFGTDDLLPAVQALFEHDDDIGIASRARAAALEAIRNNRIEPKFREYLLTYSTKCLHTPGSAPGGYSPIHILEELDPPDLAQRLHHPEILRIDNLDLGHVLARLNELNSPAPAEIYLQYLDSLSDDYKPYYGPIAFKGLGLLGHPGANDYIKEILAHPRKHDEGSVIFAWETRFKTANLATCLERALKKYQNNKTFNQLTSTEQAFTLLDHFDHMLTQEGLDIFYTDPLGMHARETILALKMIGAKKHARIFSHLTKIYGDGPHGNQEEVLNHMETLGKKSEQKIEALLEKLYSLPNWYLFALKWDWKNRKR